MWYPEDRIKGEEVGYRETEPKCCQTCKHGSVTYEYPVDECEKHRVKYTRKDGSTYVSGMSVWFLGLCDCYEEG